MNSLTIFNQIDAKSFPFSIKNALFLSLLTIISTVCSISSVIGQEYWDNYLGLATVTVEDQDPESDYYGRARTILAFRHSPGKDSEIRQILKNQLQQKGYGLRDRKSSRMASEEFTSSIDYATVRHYRENFNYYTGTLSVDVQWWETGSSRDLKRRTIEVAITKADRFQKFTDAFYHLINKMYREMNENEVLLYRPSIDMYDDKGRKVFDYYF